MGALDKMLSTVTGGGFFSGFSVVDINQGIIDISHLLFADDMLVFCNADRGSIRCTRCFGFTLRKVNSLYIHSIRSSLLKLTIVFLRGAFG